MDRVHHALWLMKVTIRHHRRSKCSGLLSQPLKIPEELPLRRCLPALLAICLAAVFPDRLFEFEIKFIRVWYRYRFPLPAFPTDTMHYIIIAHRSFFQAWGVRPILWMRNGSNDCRGKKPRKIMDRLVFFLRIPL